MYISTIVKHCYIKVYIKYIYNLILSYFTIYWH